MSIPFSRDSFQVAKAHADTADPKGPAGRWSAVAFIDFEVRRTPKAAACPNDEARGILEIDRPSAFGGGGLNAASSTRPTISF